MNRFKRFFIVLLAGILMQQASLKADCIHDLIERDSSMSAGIGLITLGVGIFTVIKGAKKIQKTDHLVKTLKASLLTCGGLFTILGGIAVLQSAWELSINNLAAMNALHLQ